MTSVEKSKRNIKRACDFFLFRGGKIRDSSLHTIHHMYKLVNVKDVTLESLDSYEDVSYYYYI